MLSELLISRRLNHTFKKVTIDNTMYRKSRRKSFNVNSCLKAIVELSSCSAPASRSFLLLKVFEEVASWAVSAIIE